METPLSASARNAGSLLSTTTFVIPQFQREYSWGPDEVGDFWNDLCRSLDEEAYFIGLIILTDGGNRRSVIDGQQRLITLSLLVAAIFHEAVSRGRKALADRLEADFLKFIDYTTDEIAPRILLSDPADNATFQYILNTGYTPDILGDSVSAQISASYKILRDKLAADLQSDPFKRLGKWSEFLTYKLYMAVFVHPDDASAYKVYEVINTRGKDLTTADLLKNFVLSQSPPSLRNHNYERWRYIARQFVNEGANNFVQYIRHAVTVESGHVPPKDLFEFISNKNSNTARQPPKPLELLDILESRLPLYLQMVDPDSSGPATAFALGVFQALNSLNVIAVRPILMAIWETTSPERAETGMQFVLDLVVRRIVVGSLGTGNIERRFGEAARKIRETGDWESVAAELRDLNPTRDDFVRQITRRPFNKNALAFLRSSIINKTKTPIIDGDLLYVWTPQFADRKSLSEEEGSYWGATLGNTYMASLGRKHPSPNNWMEFKAEVLPHGVKNEWRELLNDIAEWNAAAVEQVGTELAQAGANVWY